MANAFNELHQCATCGVEGTASCTEGSCSPRGVCAICADERQYLPPDGVQRWVTLGEQASAGAGIDVVELDLGLYGLNQRGVVGIDQQAKLIVTERGNVLVDVPAFIDEASIEAVGSLGGVAAIIPTHPHMFGAQSAWSAAFDDAPVWVSRADAQWVQREFPGLRLWGDERGGGELEPVPGVRASQPGGHFAGSSVVHFVGADGEGVLLTGDTISPVPAVGWVSFMRSYPNKLPLSGAVVSRIAAHVGSHYDFARLYDNFTGVVPLDAANAVERSARRYASWVSGEHDHLTGRG